MIIIVMLLITLVLLTAVVTNNFYVNIINISVMKNIFRCSRNKNFCLEIEINASLTSVRRKEKKIRSVLRH